MKGDPWQIANAFHAQPPEMEKVYDIQSPTLSLYLKEEQESRQKAATPQSERRPASEAQQESRQGKAETESVPCEE